MIATYPAEIRSPTDRRLSVSAAPTVSRVEGTHCPHCSGWIFSVSSPIDDIEPHFCCVGCDRVWQELPPEKDPTFPVRLRVCLGTGHSALAQGPLEMEMLPSTMPACHCCGSPMVSIRVPINASSLGFVAFLVKPGRTMFYTYIACPACPFVSQGMAAG